MMEIKNGVGKDVQGSKLVNIFLMSKLHKSPFQFLQVT